ncbi:MAG: hypothetical protein JWN60_3262 [Acidobacteria bacterium]|jgi:protein CpxP|nr:hypothetical protein [Acidobacteriota bacterium]
MFLKNKFFPALTLAFAVGTFSTYASAQTAPAPSQQDGVQKQEKRDGRGFGKRGGFGKGMRGEKGMRGGFEMRGLRGINLTDAQKEQIRTIMETNRTANQASHEEFRTLAQAKRGGTLTAEQQERLRVLREQMKQNAEASKAQVLAVLTAEQRAQLEQQTQEMEKRRQERRQMKQNRQAPDASQEN